MPTNCALHAKPAIPLFDLGLQYRVDSRRGVVVQLVRTLPCHGRGRGFESRRPRHFPSRELARFKKGTVKVLFAYLATSILSCEHYGLFWSVAPFQFCSTQCRRKWTTAEHMRHNRVLPIRMTNTIVVTGGAGFIGSNFVLQWLARESAPLLNLDCLTYAGHLDSLASVADHPRYQFVRGDINDRELVRQILQQHRPSAIVHFAAESHVDRSITGPAEFIRTNIHGT